jgi:hypothetical protein
MMNLTLAIVAALSLIVAAIMTVVAWVTVRDERRRVAARVARLAEAIHEHDDLPLRRVSGDVKPGPSPSAGQAASRGRSLTAAVVVAALVLGSVTGLLLLAERGARARTTSGAAHVQRKADAAPLELVALEHDRDENRLIVRGIVRNPASAETLKGLTVVVLVFSKAGYTASAQAPAAVASLGAGAETPFVVTLEDADWVDRFRVSFRTGDRVVPHVDRRGRNAIARTE